MFWIARRANFEIFGVFYVASVIVRLNVHTMPIWPVQPLPVLLVQALLLYGNSLRFIVNWFQVAPLFPPGPPSLTPLGPLGPLDPPHFYADPTTVRQRPSFYVQSVPSEKVLPFIHLEICSFFFDTMYTTTSTLVCISLIKVGYGILNCVE